MLFLWAGFIVVVLALVALDLFVFHRKDETVSVRSALQWSIFWVALAIAFNVGIGFMYHNHWYGLGIQPSVLHPDGLGGKEAAILFFTGYVVEQSLSMDNLFVMAVIFRYFAIPGIYQHRVLFWGILGVLILRGLMIGVGAALIARFGWVLYVFGGILLFTAYKMIFGGGEADPRKNPVLRFARRLFPATHEIHGHRFLVREMDLGDDEELEQNGRIVAHANTTTPIRVSNRWVLTPLALALLVIETTDVVFAVDSIPAIFAITTEPFLVFTSNVFAVLGLRSLYFALAGVLEKFSKLKFSLALILALIGLKMLANHWLHHVKYLNVYMLAMVAILLAAGVVASLLTADPTTPAEQEPTTPAD